MGGGGGGRGWGVGGGGGWEGGGGWDCLSPVCLTASWGFCFDMFDEVLF